MIFTSCIHIHFIYSQGQLVLCCTFEFTSNSLRDEESCVSLQLNFSFVKCVVGIRYGAFLNIALLDDWEVRNGTRKLRVRKRSVLGHAFTVSCVRCVERRSTVCVFIYECAFGWLMLRAVRVVEQLSVESVATEPFFRHELEILA